MKDRVVAFLLLALSSASNVLSGDTYDAYPQYAYSYRVDDSERALHQGKIEQRVGEVVEGQYSYLDPAGTNRTVSYKADETGFHAYIDERPGNFVPVSGEPVVPISEGTVIPINGGVTPIDTNTVVNNNPVTTSDDAVVVEAAPRIRNSEPTNDANSRGSSPIPVLHSRPVPTGITAAALAQDRNAETRHFEAGPVRVLLPPFHTLNNDPLFILPAPDFRGPQQVLGLVPHRYAEPAIEQHLVQQPLVRQPLVQPYPVQQPPLVQTLQSTLAQPLVRQPVVQHVVQQPVFLRQPPVHQRQVHPQPVPNRHHVQPLHHHQRPSQHLVRQPPPLSPLQRVKNKLHNFLVMSAQKAFSVYPALRTQLAPYHLRQDSPIVVLSAACNAK